MDARPEPDIPPLSYAASEPSGFFSRPYRSLPERVFLAVIVVVAIAYSLILVLRPRDYHPDTIDLVRQLVETQGALGTQIELYRLNTGRYPETLENLTTRPADPALAAKWGDEPYIKDAHSLLDAWGSPLQYRAPGGHNPAKFDLWTMGPDGKDGGGDDIGNWPTDHGR